MIEVASLIDTKNKFVWWQRAEIQKTGPQSQESHPDIYRFGKSSEKKHEMFFKRKLSACNETKNYIRYEIPSHHQPHTILQNLFKLAFFKKFSFPMTFYNLHDWHFYENALFFLFCGWFVVLNKMKKGSPFTNVGISL